MVIKTASPGVFYQEIDLTRGTADAITQNVAVMAGPFLKGPVDQLTLVTEEVEFQRIFGGPTDENYEYWHTVNQFLEYSGTCYVIRVDDAKGDAIDSATGLPKVQTGDGGEIDLSYHPQTMRNSTDNWGYDESKDVTGGVVDPGETFSSVYIKNEDEYFQDLNGLLPTQYDAQGVRIPGTGGVFIGRQPGTYTNGIGVAVIDAGADFQVRLKNSAPVLSSDAFVVANGGNAATENDNGISGGNSPDASVGNDVVEPPVPPTDFPSTDNFEIGTKLARYVKMEVAEDFINRSVDKVGVLSAGQGPWVDPISGVAITDGTIEGVLLDAIGDADGMGLYVDLTIVAGVITEAVPNYTAGSNPTRWKVGDIAETTLAGANEQAQIKVTDMSAQGLQIGTGAGYVVRAEYDNSDLDVPPSERPVLYYVVAMMPGHDPASSDGFGEWNSEADEELRDLEGNSVGTSKKIWTLGDFVYYSTKSAKEVNIIFEPTTYTRNQGISWEWPGRPREAELTFRGKVATNTLGEPIESDLSPNPETGAPIYETVTGPATVTESTGDTIKWDSIKQVWIQDYTPKEGDFIYDPTASTSTAYEILRQDDWYSQQVAYEGIPWSSFAKRPGTSSYAQDLGVENDEVNIIVYDAFGDATGKRGSTIEEYFLVSKLKGCKTVEGSNNFYLDLLNANSEVIYANEPLQVIGKVGLNYPTTGINAGRVNVGQPVSSDIKVAYITPRYGAIDLANMSLMADTSKAIREVPYLLNGAKNQLTASLGEIQEGYRKVVQENLADLDYIMQGPAYDLTTVGALNNTTDYEHKISAALAKANFLIALAEEMKTVVAQISPPRCAALDPVDSTEITGKVIRYADRVSSSSYAVLDSGYKYFYDRFRDKYCYTPLNCDITGCMAQTSLFSQPFFSPAGMSRGQIRNVVKLGYDPSKQQRDLLYTARVNPVVTFPGEGTVLYGDKTLLGYSSAFTRINVRRLFIYCEREIAKISKSVLFEFNDTPTRTQFLNNVNPFMRDVVSKRGAIDFLVVCDTSNNTPEVIDRNEFVADIYIKPNRSINFVQLNFVATKTGVSFSEAVATVRRGVGQL